MKFTISNNIYVIRSASAFYVLTVFVIFDAHSTISALIIIFTELE